MKKKTLNSPGEAKESSAATEVDKKTEVQCGDEDRSLGYIQDEDPGSELPRAVKSKKRSYEDAFGKLNIKIVRKEAKDEQP